MTRWQTPAIVLGSEPRGESDRRVHLLTPEAGRVWALAKGALRSRKRFAGLFDLMQELTVGLATAPRAGGILIEHASLIESFLPLRQNPKRLARASLLLELAAALAPHEAPAPAIYDLVRRGLHRLATDPDRDRFALVYAFRLLSASGLRPALSACVRCSRPPAPAEALFVAAEGGVMCPECAGAGAGFRVAPATLRTLEAVIAAPESRLSRLSFTRAASHQASELLEHFIAHQLAHPSRALAVLKTLDG